MIHRPFFQKVACFLAIITLAMSLLVFCPSCTLAEALPAGIPAEEEPADLALARLNRYAEQVMEQKNLSFGYPGNLDIHLTGFYEWLLESGVYSVMANNAGDPFDNNETYMNTLDFEREVIEFFAPFYGFDEENLWGIVTFSGTDGNNHGIYFGSKCLEKKTGKKPIVYVSDAAHYSNMRLVDLQNLDLILVPSDVHGCMIPEEFEKLLNPDYPALVVYAMGTTFKGGIDNQEKLAEGDLLGPARWPEGAGEHASARPYASVACGGGGPGGLPVPRPGGQARSLHPKVPRHAGFPRGGHRGSRHRFL